MTRENGALTCVLPSEGTTDRPTDGRTDGDTYLAVSYAPFFVCIVVVFAAGDRLSVATGRAIGSVFDVEILICPAWALIALLAVGYHCEQRENIISIDIYMYARPHQVTSSLCYVPINATP